jgi:hypothetical protein
MIDRVPSADVRAKSNWMIRVKRTVILMTSKSSLRVNGVEARLANPEWIIMGERRTLGGGRSYVREGFTLGAWSTVVASGRPATRPMLERASV